MKAEVQLRLGSFFSKLFAFSGRLTHGKGETA